MDKYKYAIELDSVCNSQKELSYALDKVLYEYIALNGNKIVLTFNQLADSTFIISFLKDTVMKDVLINLFKHNKIVVSKYKHKGNEISSAVRYIIQQINAWLHNTNNDFVFSAISCLNVSNIEQKRLILEVLKETLSYSDLNFLSSTLTKYKSTGILSITDNDIILLRNYAEFLIQISLSNIEYLPCKESEIYSLTECIDIACSALLSHKKELANKILQLKDYVINHHPTEVQKRSVWIKLNNKNSNNFQNEIEAVINACYNLAVESSISKIPSIETAINQESYFLEKYNQILNLYNLNEHQYFSVSKKYTLYDFSDLQKQYWKSVIRILEKTQSYEKTGVLTWEGKIHKFRRSRVVKYGISFVLTLLILYFSGFAIDFLLEGFSGVVKISSVIVGFIAVILGDIVGYTLTVPNLAEMFLDKERKLDLANCKNISKHKYYNKEVI